MPLTSQQRQRNDASIRAAMNRLLRGDLPANGGCDLKTLAHEAGVARTGFYPRQNRTAARHPGPTSTSQTSSTAASKPLGRPGRHRIPGSSKSPG